MQTKSDLSRTQLAVRRTWLNDLFSLWPGILLTGFIATVAFGLRQASGFSVISPMILAALIGMLIRNSTGLLPVLQAGVAFSTRGVLRFAIVLLGMQLTVGQILSLGGAGVTIITISLGATFIFTILLAKLMGVDGRLALLVGAGTAVCGASAVVATNVVVGAQQDDVSYAVASVTVLGTVAMFVYPPLGAMMTMPPNEYGLWTGTSIHEIAQVVAASFQYGRDAGEFGTLTKLSRVMLLAPLVLTIGFYLSHRPASQRGETVRPPIPWFVFWFIAVIALNSVVDISSSARGWLMSCTSFLLCVALAAMGLETQINRVLGKGLRPFMVAICASVFISVISLILIRLLA